MLAKIQVLESGVGQYLPRLVDLQRFDERQIRERLVDIGYSYDAELLVVGIEDWGVNRPMTLNQAYMLKKSYEELYDGDEYIIVWLLKKQLPVLNIIASYYRFFTKHELAVLKYYFKDCDSEELLEYVYKCEGNFAKMLLPYLEDGSLLSTSRGFYLKV